METERKRYLHVSFSCLNRTMQYGNSYREEIVILYIFGLNRTMQYGNLQVQQEMYPHMQFKSYYVVWKHHSDWSFRNS